MKQRRSHKLEALFDAALDLTPAEQAALLDRECADDPALRRELEQLLSAADLPTHSAIRSPRFHTPGTLFERNGDSDIPESPSTRADAEAGSQSADWALTPGTRIHQYELIRMLGRGGMGAVYLARDTKLGRRVAIKCLQSDRPRFAERFIVEAQTTARCNHENIVVIHEVNTHDGNPFMVLEYLKGQTLRQLIDQGAMPATRAVQYMVPVVRALACAHASQIVHRDLKPDNIFVTSTGTIKVLDFGISKFVHERQQPLITESVTSTRETVPQSPQLTRRGAIIGTLSYMSPEQWNAEKLDFRTDIWAVGIMLYEMVIGKHPLAPLRGEQLMVTAIVDQPMPSAHDSTVDVPARLADIVDGCLKKHLEARISSATQLLSLLEPLLPDRYSRELTGTESPYAGLTAFQEADADRFFGRSRDIAAVRTWLSEQPLLGVVGPSGVGKSSFIRAGVIPALKNSGDTWESFVIRPGRHPLASLAQLVQSILGSEPERATRGGQPTPTHDGIMRLLATEPGYVGTALRDRARANQRKILVFVDQFEELYTLTPDFDERVTFTNALTGVADDATSPLRVVLAIRSDFLDRIAEDRAFMAELNQGLYFLVQPDRDGLREAIVRPAEMVGHRFEKEWIVDEMLDRLDATTGALPLLQFAAMKLWESRNTADKLFTERSYRALGGIEGALASHADAVLAGLSPKEQTLVRAIFLHLVTPDRTRAITSVSELRELWHEPDTVQRLIDHLVDARLLMVQTGDTETGSLVEIVHESLIHRWPMLSHWLDEHAEDAPFLDQLKVAAKQWHGKGRPVGLLWRGDAAAEAEAWYRRYRGLLPRVQTDYLESVMALAARGARIKRVAVAGIIAFLSVLVVAAGIGIFVINGAREQAHKAAQQAQAAEAVALEKQQTIRRQYDLLQAETQAKQKAEHKADRFEQKAQEASTQVELSKEQLKVKNRELAAALGDSRENELKATKAAELARQKTDEARRAKDELEVLYKLEQDRLKRERAKVAELEKQLGAKRSRVLK